MRHAILLTAAFFAGALWQASVGAGHSQADDRQVDEGTAARDRFCSDSSIGAATGRPVRGPELVAYTNDEYSYQLQYPKGWEVVEARPRVNDRARWEGDVLLEGQAQKVTFLEKEYRIWQGEFRVCVWRRPDKLDFERWLSEHEPEDVAGGSLVQASSDTTLSGQPARWLSIFGFDHEQIDIICPWEGRVYQICYAGANPNDPHVVEHRGLYQRMLSSFRFTH